jgi:hypothetical protein
MTSGHIANCKALFGFLLVVTCLPIRVDAAEKKYTKQEIKDLLNRVWQASELDLNNFRNYVFCEKEVQEPKLLSGNWGCIDDTVPETYHREYIWTVLHGHFVRVLTRANGLDVTADQQKESVKEWIRQENKKGIVNTLFDYLIHDYGASRFGSILIASDLKANDYKYKDDKVLDQRRLIALKSSSRAASFTFFIAPEVNRPIRFQFDLGGGAAKGGYSIILGQPIDDVWLPVKCTGFLDMELREISPPQTIPNLPQASNRPIPQRSYRYKPACHYTVNFSREFYSFKKSDVKAKFWFENVDAEIGRDTEKPQAKQ